MHEAEGTGNPSSLSRACCLRRGHGNPISEAQGKGSQSICLWPVCVEGPWPAGGKQVGGSVGGLWAGWGELAEGLARSSTQSVCYAVPGLACIYLC